MNREEQHTDDFKQLFDSHQMPYLPKNLEDKIMAGIEIKNLSSKSPTPLWLTRNLIIFCSSIFILTLLAVFEFMTGSTISLLSDFKMLTLLSSVVFFILWITESIEIVLLNKFQNNWTSLAH